MAAIEEVEWEDCCLEPRRDPELERYARTELGVVLPTIRYLAPAPWVPRALVGFSVASRQLTAVSHELGDLLALVVSRDNSCRFCFAATRFLLRISGMSEERIRHLEQDLLTADLGPPERAALELARKLSRANPMPARRELEELGKAGWSQAAVVDIVAGAAVTGFANRVTTFPAVPTTRMEGLPDRLPVRWLSPLLRRVLQRLDRRSSGRARSFSLDPDTLKGPFAYAVRAVDGSPVAPVLRDMIDEAWSSPQLTPRTRALVCAVVARALADAHSEREAARLLELEGLGADDLEEVLSHLASPRLDPIETEAVPFARETIRYQPAPIQRKVRALGEKLEPPQLVELIGMVSLANMLSRLGVLVAH